MNGRFRILRAERAADAAGQCRAGALDRLYGAVRGARHGFRRTVRSAGGLSVATTRPLGAGEGLTIVAEIPAGIVAPPDRADEARYFLRDYRGWIIGTLGLAALLAYYLCGLERGRPRSGRRDHHPAVPPARGRLAGARQLHPQLGLRASGWKAFTAAALSLAVRGLLVFDQRGRPRSATAPTSAGRRRARWRCRRASARSSTGSRSEGGRAEINKAKGKAVVEVGKAFQHEREDGERRPLLPHNLFYFFVGCALGR